MASEPVSTTTTKEQTGPDEETDHDAVLELESVHKSFGSEEALHDFNLSLRSGELLTLLGPSGCGKTTALRLMAGLETPSAGRIQINDTTVASDDVFVSPEDRDVGIVFQDFALFPHLSVEENIAFGLDDDADHGERVTELLDLVGLQGYRDRAPSGLSGGEQQRVALARSLAPEPEILLLDEPFSNLDVRLRVQMREEVRRILNAAGVSAISVTHDQEEALSICDRVAVMNDGRIAQVGTPEMVFEHPESRFVASFLGQASFLSASLDSGTITTVLGEFTADRLKGISSEYDGAELDVLVRPDDLYAVPAPASEADGEIIYRHYTGPSFIYRVELTNGDVVHCQHNHVAHMELGDPVTVSLEADHSLAWYPRRA